MNDAPATSSQTLRERVLTALEHFWCPLRVDDELRPYLEGIWHEPVATDALAGLLAAERHAFDQAVARPVWICCGIWPDGHGEPGWWARSDWPLWVRVVDPDGEQARRCWLLRQLYRAPVIPSSEPASPLTGLWVRLAAHLPAAAVAWLRAPVDRGDPAVVSDWKQDRFAVRAEAADWQFDLLAAEDRRRRQRFAQRLTGKLSPAAQLLAATRQQVDSKPARMVPVPSPLITATARGAGRCRAGDCSTAVRTPPRWPTQQTAASSWSRCRSRTRPPAAAPTGWRCGP